MASQFASPYNREYAEGSNHRNSTQRHSQFMSSISRKPLPAIQRGSRETMNSVMTTGSSAGVSEGTNITEPPAFSRKIVVVGDGGCGKTCLLISYSQGYFPEKYVPTVFENYITQVPHAPSGKSVELALWDTAGQEEYDRLRPLSYPETDLLFVCFAIDCPNSLENVMDKWYPEVLHFCPTTPVILLGLKSDLRYKRNCIELLRTQGLTPVSTEQGRAVAERMGATYMECSSKEMDGVEEIFDTAINIAVGDEWRQSSSGRGSSSKFGAGMMSNGTSGGSDPRFVGKKKKSRSCKIL